MTGPYSAPILRRVSFAAENTMAVVNVELLGEVGSKCWREGLGDEGCWRDETFEMLK